MSLAEDILHFWFEELAPEDWFKLNPELDARIRTRFLPAWEEAREGTYRDWLETPRGAMAYLVITDQFPRNMFRGDARAFATDALALSAARMILDLGHDLAWPEKGRAFFYLPFEHSEDMVDQDRSVTLFSERIVENRAEVLLHAEAHHAIIRRFGRFPFRNAALGRESTDAEKEFLDQGAYPGILRLMREARDRATEPVSLKSDQK